MPRGLRAGELTERVVVQRLVSSTPAGGAGERVTTPEQLFTVWAKVAPVSGGEQFRSGQRLTLETAIFTVRQRSDWMPDAAVHQLVYRGKTWDITYVAETGPRVGWELTAEVRG
jgi:SPP1 family predicted phage head-tail adaptor